MNHALDHLKSSGKKKMHCHIPRQLFTETEQGLGSVDHSDMNMYQQCT